MAVKAITLWQPWASLLFTEYKRFETRSWGTTYRGEMAIHAAKRPPRNIPPALAELCCDAFGGHWFMDLPRGAVIGTAMLSECLPTGAVSLPRGDDDLLTGDWSPGRFAWRFIDHRPLSIPSPCHGMQRIWNWRL